MKKLDVIAIDSYTVSEEESLPQELTHKLYKFTGKSYHLADQQEFERLIIQPEVDGKLTVLYGMNDDIAGFSRICKQHLTVGKKQVTVFYAYIYLNPDYKICSTVESAGIEHAIKEKLSHPQDELVYIAFANNPLTYEFVYQLSDSIYPKPFQKIPEQVINIISTFNHLNGWISSTRQPFVINSPLVPLRSQIIDFQDEENELNEFYMKSNPDYMQGHCILVYMPLHLANINYGLSYQDSIYHHNQKPHHNTHLHNDDSQRLRGC